MIVAAAVFLLLARGSGGVVVERLEYPDPAGASPGLTREVTLDERFNCTVGDIQPPNRVDTTERVARLRQEMANYGIEAYLILTADQHQSEYVSPADKRLNYVSGFSGSAGMVVVTMTQQALWTDGRYFLQADSQMDCNWLLMKSGLEGVPSVLEWIKEVLPSGARVGSDPNILTANMWMSYESSLAASGIIMVYEETDLVDLIWTDRPAYPSDPAIVLDINFAGQSWESKMDDVRAAQGADVLVLTALDDVAWLLNLRGSDIPYNPVFRGYVLLGQDRVQLFTPSEKVSPEVALHLHVGECVGDVSTCVEIFEYDSLVASLGALESDPAVSSVLVSTSSSYSIYNAVPVSKRVTGNNPIPNMKAQKNEIERAGMKRAHLKDGVALCDFLAFMESEIGAGAQWDELSASNKSEEFRSQQEDYMGLSFSTISAFGPNGAIIHYFPVEATNIAIDTSSLYLLDSGTQFLDGTTDVTRTMHYGDPEPFQVETYTRVLQGQLDFADIIFPASSGISYSTIDILARRPLYELGLDYRHGTSHGIGMFLYVHESTCPYYVLGEFMSDEPGYYQDGEFGIRLENTVEVVEAITPYNFTSSSLTFQFTTLVPYESKLINTTMLTRRQCTLLNEYHSRVRTEVGQEMLSQGLQDGYDWLVTKTEPLAC